MIRWFTVCKKDSLNLAADMNWEYCLIDVNWDKRESAMKRFRDWLTMQ